MTLASALRSRVSAQIICAIFATARAIYAVWLGTVLIRQKYEIGKMVEIVGVHLSLLSLKRVFQR